MRRKSVLSIKLGITNTYTLINIIYLDHFLSPCNCLSSKLHFPSIISLSFNLHSSAILRARYSEKLLRNVTIQRLHYIDILSFYGVYNKKSIYLDQEFVFTAYKVDWFQIIRNLINFLNRKILKRLHGEFIILLQSRIKAPCR